MKIPNLFLVFVLFLGCSSEKKDLNLSENSTQNPTNLSQNAQDLSIYRAKYAKPTSEWDKPNIDESVVEWQEFAPISRPSVPEDNKFIGAKAHLGRNLFNDPRLSKSGQIACESCHRKELSSTDGLPKAVGHDLQVGRRNAPNTQMAGFFPLLFWDGRAASLEEQVLGPITDPLEMANTLENAEMAIKNAPEYYALFVSAFGDDDLKAKWAEYFAWILPKTEPEKQAANKAIHTHKIEPEQEKPDFLGIKKLENIDATMLFEMKEQESEIFDSYAFRKILKDINTSKAPQDDILSRVPQNLKNEAKKLITIENIAKAIATFERGPGVARRTRFNDFLKGDYAALSDLELYGLDIFRNKGRCMNCHYGAILSDTKFHNVGSELFGRAGQDLGRYEVTGKSEDIGAFKTPSLVNVGKTAPYLHNGMSPNLTGVIMLFNEAFPIPPPSQADDNATKPIKSHLIKPLNLNINEIKALEAFLKTL